jgi:hypothetical protein
VTRRLYGKIPHLPGSRTGPSDRHVDEALAARCTLRERAGDTVLVQEKLDGSCVAIVREPERGAIVAYGREGRPCATARNDGRRAFAAWVAEQAGRFEACLAPGERLVGEWLAVAHGTRYALPHEPFVAFDLFGADGARATFDTLAARAAAARLAMPHLLHRGGALGLEVALERLGTHGFHGALDPAEGLVWRVESADAVAAVAKYVRPGKQDGCYLADHTGQPAVANTWHDPAR